MADTGLWAAAVGADVTTVMSSGDLLERLLETFVINQLRAETALMTRSPQLFHLRVPDGRREVDMLADFGARGVVAIEIKATTAPDVNDARHLAWLRDELGPQFAAGAVLHVGRRKFRLSAQIEAIPICALWAASLPTEDRPLGHRRPSFVAMGTSSSGRRASEADDMLADGFGDDLST